MVKEDIKEPPKIRVILESNLTEEEWKSAIRILQGHFNNPFKYIDYKVETLGRGADAQEQTKSLPEEQKTEEEVLNQ